MELIGHQKQWQYLQKLAKENKLPHAFLFSGQEKLGKKTLAIEFIKLFFCQDIDKKPHPDFIFIKPEKKEIQISQIRECLWKLSLKPVLSSVKIALIDQAHFLNIEAQNAFLKTLEEPKGKAHIFLITEYPEKLLSTIVSRCQILKFYPVSKEEIEKYLKKQNISDIKIKEITNNCLGKPGLAVDFIKNKDFSKEQEKIISDFLKISKSDIVDRFEYAKNLAKNSQNLKIFFDVLLRYFRKMMILEISRNEKDKNVLEKIKKIKKFINLIEETNFLISWTNINPRLALEILMLEL